MIVLLLPFYVITWALDGVMREVNKATAGAFLKARDKAKAKVKAWAAKPKKKLRVPPKAQKAWAWTASHTAAAGRLAGRLIPEAVVEGARRGATEGKERHREAREIRPLRRNLKHATRSAQVDPQRSREAHAAYMTTRERIAADREARRTGQPVGTENAPEPQPTVVEGEVVEQSPSEPTVVIPAQAPRQSRNWDKCPETPADKRFHDLRESGWTGWIDQDGNPMTDEQHAEWCRDQEQEINGNRTPETNGHEPANGSNNNGHTPSNGGEAVNQEQFGKAARFNPFPDGNTRPNATSLSSADSPNGGPIEVTSVDSLRRVYASTGQDVAALKDQIGSASQRLQAATSTYEQATGHMSSDGFSPQTLSDVAGVQEAVSQAAAKAAEALAALDAAEGAASSATRGLDQYRPAEEAISSVRAPRSTASLRME